MGFILKQKFVYHQKIIFKCCEKKNQEFKNMAFVHNI